jgi:hypothetical protein
MADFLRIEVGGGAVDAMDRVNLKLGILARQLPDMREVNKHQVVTLEDYARRQFESEGRYGGQPWATYEEAGDWRHRRVKHSVLYKAKHGRWPSKAVRRRKVPRMALLRWVLGGPKTPIQSGERLYPSFFRGHAGNVWQSRVDGFTWGTEVPYAERHQRGIGRRKWDPGTVPKRAILTNTRRLRGPLVRNIQEHVLEQVAAVDPAGGAGGVGDQLARPTSPVGLREQLREEFGV